MEKRKLLVLDAKRYSFPDQQTGEIKEGTTVHYVDLETEANEDLNGCVTVELTKQPVMK
jgi:hypothetical protein